MTTTNKKLQFSINTHLVDKTPPDDPKMMGFGFQPVEWTLEDLAEAVSVEGWAFSYQHHHNRRVATNFKATDILAVDIDGGIRIEEMLEKPLVQSSCSMLYTTASHTADHHRFRMVFILPRTITKAAEFTAATKALARRLGGDMSATDAARIFFGSRGCNLLVFDRALSNEMLDELIKDGQVVPRRDSSGHSMSTSNRSNLKLDPQTEVQTAAGSTIKISTVERTTSIYCPYHPDRSPSAFVSRNKNNRIYLRCSTCQLTWWVSGHEDVNFDFYDFEKTIKKLKDKNFRNVVEDTPFGDFIEPLEAPLKNIHIVNEPHLQISKLEEGISFIKSPKGSGKTTFLSDAIRKAITRFATLEEYEEGTDFQGEESILTKEKVLLIGHRRALIGDLCNKLNLSCYLDDEKLRQGEVHERQKRYGICLDSLMKIRGLRYDIVVIDEVEQVLSHFLSETVGEKRQALFRLFCEQIRSAKKVVALDADLGWVSFLTLTTLIHGVSDRSNSGSDFPVHIYLNEHVSKNSDLHLYESHDQLVEHMQRSIIDGKRVFVTSNSKEKIKTLNKTVEKLAADHDLKISIKTITSENSQHEDTQKFIKQIKSEILKLDVTLSSPSLGTGIDITFDGDEQKIDCVYGFFENLINSHFEIDQQIARVRHPGSVHVWVSPSTFKFETDFGVVRDDYLHDQMIDLSVTGRHSQTGLPVGGIDPFFIMAAMITTIQRASKNKLKRNFIDYKERNGWTVQYQNLDEEMIGLGRSAFKKGRNAKDLDDIEQILSAKTFNRVEYIEFKKKIESNDGVTSSDELHSFRKTNLEHFYGEPVTSELIEKDDRGNYSKRVKRFESLIGSPDVWRQSLNVEPPDKNIQVQNRIFPNYAEGTKILFQLFSLVPVFVNGRFIVNKFFTKHDLSEFAKICQRLSRQIETHLKICVRNDVLENPVRQLGDMLKLVGLKHECASSTTTNREKINNYFLDRVTLNEVKALVERRKSPDMTGWGYINRTHGFEYTQDEWDLIMT